MGFPGTWDKSYHHLVGDEVFERRYDLVVEVEGRICALRCRLKEGGEIRLRVPDDGSSWRSFREEVGDGDEKTLYYGAVGLIEQAPFNLLVGMVVRRRPPNLPGDPEEDMGTFTAVKRPGPGPGQEPPRG